MKKKQKWKLEKNEKIWTECRYFGHGCGLGSCDSCQVGAENTKNARNNRK